LIVHTIHAERRAQQRGVGSDIIGLLERFGDRRPAGAGAVIRFFSTRSVEQMKRHLGQKFVAAMHEKLRSYTIESRTTGVKLTVGKLYSRTRVPRSKPKGFH
jgi:hypothetical protein